LNRQIFPSALFPLRGDLLAEAGATTVTVVGIQQIPITAPCLSINGVGQTFDKEVFINGIPDGATVWGIDINGTSDGSQNIIYVTG
jgi:hypothetical protein